MKFDKWIMRYLAEKSEFGDLARNYRDAVKVDTATGMKKQPLNESYLMRWNATGEAFQSLKKAKELYIREKNLFENGEQ